MAAEIPGSSPSQHLDGRGSELTGGGAVVEMLRRHGVDTVFTVPGEQIDPLFGAFAAEPTGLRVVSTRTEQGAALMAYGYSRASGRVGTLAVISGPGVLNAGSGLATGYAGNARMLCLAGQIPRALIDKGIGALHATNDQAGLLRSLTKWSARVDAAEQVPQTMCQAFRQLSSGRPRPVAVELPADVLSQSGNVRCIEPELQLEEAEPEPELVSRAAELLARASRPLLYVGGGAVGAAEEVLAIAQLLGAAVVSNNSGAGIVSSEHPLSLSAPGGHRLWARTDVVLAVGTRLYQPQTQWGLDNSLSMIRVDIDADEVERIAKPQVGIVGDAKKTLAAMYDELRRRVDRGRGHDQTIAAVKAELTREFAAVKPQHEFLMAIRAELPKDGIFVDELTQVGYVARFAFPVYRPGTYIPATYQGTLGFGFATALGAKVAYPERCVVSVNGDGGFLYNAQELATAVQEGIGVVAIVFNDNAYGNIKRSQLAASGRSIGCDLHNPDFVRLAEAYGAGAERVRTPSELRAALRGAFARSGPSVIEVPVGPMASPWQYIRMGRVRG
ncbi:MAG: hypothetical protein RJA70_1004 [Pseudomonadota bacterium]|jgi:acetolactate synthase-1/2/3 large subunit